MDHVDPVVEQVRDLAAAEIITIRPGHFGMSDDNALTVRIEPRQNLGVAASHNTAMDTAARGAYRNNFFASVGCGHGGYRRQGI